MEVILLTATGVYLGIMMSAAFLYAFSHAVKIKDWDEASWPVLLGWIVPLLTVSFTAWLYG